MCIIEIDKIYSLYVVADINTDFVFTNNAPSGFIQQYFAVDVCNFNAVETFRFCDKYNESSRFW